MTYAIMKKTTKLMPLMRHKRSQNTGVVYTLVEEVDALMRISSRTEGEFGAPPPAGDQSAKLPPPQNSTPNGLRMGKNASWDVASMASRKRSIKGWEVRTWTCCR